MKKTFHIIIILSWLLGSNVFAGIKITQYPPNLASGIFIGNIKTVTTPAKQILDVGIMNSTSKRQITIEFSDKDFFNFEAELKQSLGKYLTATFDQNFRVSKVEISDFDKFSSFKCPKTVACTKDGCKPSDGSMSAFLPPKFGYFGDEFGAYRFTFAQSSFHEGRILARCIYHPHFNLELNIKPELTLEGNLTNKTNWVLKDTLECSSTDPSMCPFKEKSAFVVHNMNIPDGIQVSANGNKITVVNQEAYAHITYESVLVGCGTQKTCAIDLMTSNSGKIGSVTVDMDNKMNILDVAAIYPQQIHISKLKNLKAVEISYLSMKR